MHIKRIALPKTWQSPRKGIKFATKPAGYTDKSLPLNIILRDLLCFGESAREVRQILNKKGIFVDNVVRRDIHFPVRLMSVLSVKEKGENFRMLMNSRGKLFLHKIGAEEAMIKPCKILSKKVLGKEKIQINLDDGRNIISQNSTYKTKDTLLLNLKDKSFEHIRFEAGSYVYLYGGSKVGKIGKIDAVKGETITVKFDNASSETLSKFAIAVGKEKPEITIS